jgi:hypothetical protein
MRQFGFFISITKRRSKKGKSTFTGMPRKFDDKTREG